MTGRLLASIFNIGYTEASLPYNFSKFIRNALVDYMQK